jgi:hypothetical protein
MFGRKRRVAKDPLQREAAARRLEEDERPWFLGDDGPTLDVEAGRSARMEDLDDD